MNSIEIVYEWLLAATLRASVLAVVILSLQYSLRRWLPAAWRHALWLPMLAVMIVPVLLEAPFAIAPRIVTLPVPVVAPVVAPAVAPAVAPVVAPVVAPAVVHSTATVELTAISAPAITMNAPEIPSAPQVAAKFNILPIVWFVGACGVLGVGFIGYRRNMRRIGMHATAPDRVLQASIAEAAREAGLKRAPLTMISPDVASPAVTGFTRPVLLLPVGFPEGFSAAEARLILLHEFTHLKRYDLPLNWVMCVLQAMHWFNPLLWFAFARMRADREMACDARVLSIDATDRRAEYGGALLKLQCVTPTRALSLGFVGIFERGSEIKSRIREISEHRPGRRAWRVAGGSLVTLLMVFGCTKRQQASPPADETKTVTEVAPAGAVNSAGKERIQKKLNSIIVPSIDFEDTTIEEAIDFLRLRSAELDVAEKDLANKGINIVNMIKRSPGNAAPQTRMIHNLRIKNVPLGTTIKYICDQTNLHYTVDDSAVILSSVNEVVEKPATAAVGENATAIQKKLDSIIIPRIDFEDTTLDEAIEFLRQRSEELDVEESDPQKKGLNFVIKPLPAELMIANSDIVQELRPADAEPKALRIHELRIKNVPLGTVIKYLCEQTNHRYTLDAYAVILSPRLDADGHPVMPKNR